MNGSTSQPDRPRPQDERTARALRDILAITDTAGRLVARGKEDFDAYEVIRLAAEAVLHKIGQAVARLPADFVDAHPGVAWRNMKATRNLLAHRYGQVDYGIIWRAFAVRLPREAERIRAILGSET